MKAEPLMAKLYELRKEAEGDPSDMEWLALHHAFCFISYKMGDFQKYLDEVAEKGEDEEG
jgi:adenylosuccinate lyase